MQRSRSTAAPSTVISINRRRACGSRQVFAVFSDGQDNSSQKQLRAGKGLYRLSESGGDHDSVYQLLGGGVNGGKRILGFCNILDVTSSASELRRAFDCLVKIGHRVLQIGGGRWR